MSKPNNQTNNASIIAVAKQVQALADKATPGPWIAANVVDEDGTVDQLQISAGEDGDIICSIEENIEENQEFIAASRTNAPLLADAVIELSAQKDEMAKVLLMCAKHHQANCDIVYNDLVFDGAALCTCAATTAKALLTKLGVTTTEVGGFGKCPKPSGEWE